MPPFKSKPTGQSIAKNYEIYGWKNAACSKIIKDNLRLRRAGITEAHPLLWAEPYKPAHILKNSKHLKCLSMLIKDRHDFKKVERLVIKLGEAIKGKRLYSFTLHCYSAISHTEVVTLMRILKNSKMLTSVNFIFDSIDLKDKQMLMRVLRYNKNLKSIDCQFNPSDMLENLNASLKNTTLQSLSLTFSKHSTGNPEDLVFLKTNRLQLIKLSTLSNAAAPLLSYVLTNNPALKSLNLANNKFTSEGFQVIGKTVSSSGITHLDLSQSYLDLSRSQVDLLCNTGIVMTLVNSNLYSLNLSGINLTIFHLNDLGMLIKNNPKLAILILNNNRFFKSINLDKQDDRDHIRDFMETLKQSQMISLEFRDTALTEKHIVILKNIIEKNEKLIRLDLSNNDLSERSLGVLDKALESNTSLHEMTLEAKPDQSINNSNKEALIKHVEKQLERNKSIGFVKNILREMMVEFTGDERPVGVQKSFHLLSQVYNNYIKQADSGDYQCFMKALQPTLQEVAIKYQAFEQRKDQLPAGEQDTKATQFSSNSMILKLFLCNFSEFNKIRLSKLFDENLLILKETIDERDPLYRHLNQALKDLLSKIGPLTMKQEASTYLFECLAQCDAHIQAASTRFAHGSLYRIAEVLIKIITGVICGIAMLLGAIVCQGIANPSARNVYRNTFLKLNQTAASRSLFAYKERLHESFEIEAEKSWDQTDEFVSRF